jgi:hypothetical protein
MKLTILFTILNIFISFSSFTQVFHASAFSAELSKSLAEGKYTTIGEFNEFGIAPVSKTMVNGVIKWGFVNRDGKEIIPMIYDAITAFDKFGLAVASEKLKMCFDLTSEKCQADVIYDFKGNIVFGKANQMIKLKVMDTLLRASLIVIKSLTSYQDKAGEIGYNLVRKDSLKAISNELLNYYQVVANNEILIKSKGKAWTIDFSGKDIFTLKFKDIVCASEGVYGVQYQNDKYGFVDKKGRILASFDYESISPFKNGLSIVSKGIDKMGIITKFNAQIAPCTFRLVEFRDNFYYLTEENGQTYTLNNNGDCMSNCEKFNKLLKKENAKK